MSGGLRPCPFCGSEFLVLHVDRLRKSFIKCECGASVSIDCTRCSDPSVGMLVGDLETMWNRRVGDEPEAD